MHDKYSLPSYLNEDDNTFGACNVDTVAVNDATPGASSTAY